MKSLLLLAAVCGGIHVPQPSTIAIRHDVNDSLYVALGDRYPAVVRVGANGGDGTLIAPDWVLTAGHVAAGMVRRSDGNVEIFVDGRETGYRADQVILHPDFAPMGPSDIALIHLARAVTDIVPVKLYRDNDEVGQMIVLVGHGDTKPGTGGEWVVDRQRRGATNLIDEATPEHIIFDFDDPETATALEGTAGPGDSGGPAFIERGGALFVAGVSSLGEPGKNGAGTYGAREHYVRVSAHAPWIDGVFADPPKEQLVNMPDEDTQSRKVRVGPGGTGRTPPGVVVLEEIGLLIAEREGRIRMVGRIDARFPEALLSAGVRPPSAILSINGQAVSSTQQLKSAYEAISIGKSFTLEFELQGDAASFDIVK